MSSDIAISVRDLGKSYSLSHAAEEGASCWRRVIRSLRGEQRETFWALRHVSFDIREGGITGIIGRNGAGKSTLLKIMSRITRPTTGEVELRGRIGSLLEVGTGFHRELTGRENIYLNGGILGMTRREINKRFDEIVDFAGTEKFLDTPVKRYSSGMFVRLAFAVAAHLQPDILIVDEVLSVGDAEFQRKCLGKMNDASREGRTVLLVSHNIATVQSLCHRCIWLDEGRLRLQGNPETVIAQYLGDVVEVVPEIDLRQHGGRTGEHALMQRVRLANHRGEASAAISIGETLRIQILVEPGTAIHQPSVGIGVSNCNGQRVFTVHTRYSSSRVPVMQRQGWIECEIPNVMLMPGKYVLKLALGVHDKDLDVIENAAAFEVLPCDYFSTGSLPSPSQGVMLQNSRWRMLDAEMAEMK